MSEQPLPVRTDGEDVDHASLLALTVRLLTSPPFEVTDGYGLRWRASSGRLELGTGPCWDPFLVGDAFDVAREMVRRKLT